MSYMLSSMEYALASLSRCLDGSEIDAWGLSREMHINPTTAEVGLNAAVMVGKAYKNGSWYGPTESFKAEVRERLAERERLVEEYKKKFPSQE